MLNREGFEAVRRHVATLMRRMGIEALYRKPNTSKKHPTHKVYPYLLRGLKIDHANQVWATDITYTPMACGWVYRCAIVDSASRRVLSHRVSISMDPSFCVEALQEAFGKYGHLLLPGRPCRFDFLSFVDGIRGAHARAHRPFNSIAVKTCHTSMVS
jgi:putative transposase